MDNEMFENGALMDDAARVRMPERQVHKESDSYIDEYEEMRLNADAYGEGY